MSLRKNIYYWKCDSPQSEDDKRSLYFKDKYNIPGIEQHVKDACSEYFGDAAASVKAAGCDGNHFAYIVSRPEGKYFFRADSGSSQDEYMLAEAVFMKLTADAGLPVPELYHTDISMERHPLRYQIMALAEGQALNYFHKNGSLDLDSIASQLGEILRRLHSIKLDGFGFMNTDELKKGNTICLDYAYKDYFYNCLDRHLFYLESKSLLASCDIADIKAVFKDNESLLKLEFGSLVHRDMALWNVLGFRERITAVIDWDDAVSGDPADDIGMLGCFYDSEFIEQLLLSYDPEAKLGASFRRRITLHTLRNMLWKTMIRDYMGYFERDSEFFLINSENKSSLKDFTLGKLFAALNELRRA